MKATALSMIVTGLLLALPASAQEVVRIAVSVRTKARWLHRLCPAEFQSQ